MDTAGAPQDPPVATKPTDDPMNDTTTPLPTSTSAPPGAGMMDNNANANDDEGAIHESNNSQYNPTGLGSGIRPIFMGNLSHSALSSDVEHMFRNPVSRGSGGYGGGGEQEKEEGMASEIAPFDLDRVDMKRGYCFVFLQDPKTIEEKNRIEAYVGEINGMYVSSSSSILSSSSYNLSSSIICSTT
mmetsp:Transcript_27973/g.43980  ORF Transcript_27973/g.43980 Transcript_27973/m.43980 type:complete len:186 (+) Transcript_27973:71-628(+)